MPSVKRMSEAQSGRKRGSKRQRVEAAKEESKGDAVGAVGTVPKGAILTLIDTEYGVKFNVARDMKARGLKKYPEYPGSKSLGNVGAVQTHAAVLSPPTITPFGLDENDNNKEGPQDAEAAAKQNMKSRTVSATIKEEHMPFWVSFKESLKEFVVEHWDSLFSFSIYDILKIGKITSVEQRRACVDERMTRGPFRTEEALVKYFIRPPGGFAPTEIVLADADGKVLVDEEGKPVQGTAEDIKRNCELTPSWVIKLHCSSKHFDVTLICRKLFVREPVEEPLVPTDILARAAGCTVPTPPSPPSTPRTAQVDPETVSPDAASAVGTPSVTPSPPSAPAQAKVEGTAVVVDDDNEGVDMDIGFEYA